MMLEKNYFKWGLLLPQYACSNKDCALTSLVTIPAKVYLNSPAKTADICYWNVQNTATSQLPFYRQLSGICTSSQ